MQRTLNRELKELEVVGREAIVTCGERRSGRGLSLNGETMVIRDFCLWSHPASVRSSSRYQLKGYNTPLVMLPPTPGYTGGIGW